MNHTSKFAEHQIQLAQMAKSLGHPARIAIIEHLMVQDACICGEIVSALPLSQSTVSQHLKALKDQDIILGAIDGPKVCYRLNTKKLKEMSAIINRFLSSSDGFPSCC